jgi:hypothetical protein
LEYISSVLPFRGQFVTPRIGSGVSVFRGQKPVPRPLACSEHKQGEVFGAEEEEEEQGKKGENEGEDKTGIRNTIVVWRRKRREMVRRRERREMVRRRELRRCKAAEWQRHGRRIL